MDLTGAIDVLVPTIHAHASAADLKEYADTIPIHRLQFLHNKSTIVLVDVQTSTFHIGLLETRSCHARGGTSARRQAKREWARQPHYASAFRARRLLGAHTLRVGE